MTIEMSDFLKKPFDTANEEIDQMITRIIKLSQAAENPGVAYRNLETIHALAESLAKKLKP